MKNTFAAITCLFSIFMSTQAYAAEIYTCPSQDGTQNRIGVDGAGNVILSGNDGSMGPACPQMERSMGGRFSKCVASNLKDKIVVDMIGGPSGNSNHMTLTLLKNERRSIMRIVGGEIMMNDKCTINAQRASPSKKRR